jgi:ribonuclease G
MAKNILVLSCDIRETRVALIEDGIIAELHIERRGPHGQSGAVGNVYLGKVTRVLPGLQAAFIDIGQERAAFLHVEDLIRPDDFEGYLSGGKKFSTKQEDIEEIATGDEELDAEKEAELEAQADEVIVAPAADDTSHAALPALSSVPDLDEDDEGHPEDEAADRSSAPPPAAEDDEDDSGEPLPQDEDEDGDEDVEDPEDAVAAHAVAEEHRAHPHVEGDLDELEPSTPPPPPSSTRLSDAPARWEEAEGERSSSHPPASEPGLADVLEPEEEQEEAADELDDAPTVALTGPFPGAPKQDLPDWPDMPGFTVSEPGAPARRAASPERFGNRRRRGRGRGRGREGGREGSGRESQGREGGGRGRGESRDNRRGGESRDNRREGGRGRDNRRDEGRLKSQSRISKSTPIKDVVKEGQDVVVQVTKEPIGTKGARCTSHVSLPGRYVVYLPTVEHVGISKRIGSEQERARLREAIANVKPPTGGLIVRTVAEGLTKKQLKQDVGYLVRLWAEIAKKKSEAARAPALLMGELDLVLKTARDLFTDEVDQIVIDDRREYDRLLRFVEMFAPDRLKDVVLYNGDEPIFDAYGIEDEIQRALARKVPLPSGGYLIIDQAEALTAIDVNTGRFVGKNSKDMEETILKTNLEAVHEIAYQLRFRNIGGLIILDLIDMEKAANREKVRRALEDVLQKDKAKTSLNRISDLGLIEMTRKRTRESLGRLLHEPCFYCDGTGQLMSKETIAYEILREVRRKRADLPGYTVIVNCHPAVADLLQGAEKGAIADAENKFMRKIQVFPRGEYHYEQFDISGK